MPLTSLCSVLRRDALDSFPTVLWRDALDALHHNPETRGPLFY